MILECFPCGPIETNAYIVVCEKTNKALIVDAPQGIAAIVAKKDYLFDKIILTHSHWDHVLDLAALKNLLHVPIYVHESDAENIKHPGADGLGRHIKWEGVTPDGYLKDGDTVTVGEIVLQVIHTPGHSPGGICLYIEKEKVLLSGDTLFAGCMGRVDLPTSDPHLMLESLKKLAKLPSDTKVYPGHAEATTIGSENWIRDAEKKFG